MPAPEGTRSLRDAVWWAVLPGAVLFLCLQLFEHVSKGVIGFDSHAYWLAAREPETWYLLAPGFQDAYLYSPAFAQLLWPVAQLPWPVFQALWAVLEAGLLSWLLWPLGWRRGLTIAPFFMTELMLGNVYILFAAALVVGVTRWPGSLAFFSITKLAPSVVFFWFVVRREWRSTAVALATTGTIVGISFAISPHAWVEWLHFLWSSTGDGSVGAPFRALLAVVVVVWAARADHAWLLAPAVLLGCPVFGGWGPLAVLAAIPRLLKAPKLHRAASSTPASTDRTISTVT